jgi:hypothetical protein
VVPPERPSPLRVCRYLSNNALNGSVPSSLSALTNLVVLCVPPSCQRRLRVRPRRAGSVGSAPSAWHVGGCMPGASSGGGAAAGLLQCSQRGARARDVTTEYSRGTPPMGTVRGYRRGTSLLRVRRSTAERPSPLSGVQIPQQQYTDGECAELALRAHQAFSPVRGPFLPTAFARAAEEGRDRSALLRAARHVGECMSGASSGGGAAAGLLRYSQRGPRARDVTKEHSRGTPSHGYGARVP